MASTKKRAKKRAAVKRSDESARRSTYADASPNKVKHKRKQQVERKPTPTRLPIPGFKLASTDIPNRLVILIGGSEGAGKTHLACTAPGDIMYQSVDLGEEGVVDKFVGKKNVHVKRYPLKEVRSDLTSDKQKSASKKEALKVFDEYVRDHVAGLESKLIRTIVCDTVSDLKRIDEVAAFARIAKILPRDRTEASYEFDKLTKLAFGFDKNVIWLAKLGDVWENDKRTGDQEVKRTGEVKYAAHIVVTAYSDTDKDGDRVFWFEVEKCRVRTSLVGKVYEWPENTLPHLASDIYDIDPDDWR